MNFPDIYPSIHPSFFNVFLSKLQICIYFLLNISVYSLLTGCIYSQLCERNLVKKGTNSIIPEHGLPLERWGWQLSRWWCEVIFWDGDHVLLSKYKFGQHRDSMCMHLSVFANVYFRFI